MWTYYSTMDNNNNPPETNPQSGCQVPWSGKLVYIYGCVFILIAIIGLVGIMFSAYNRNGTSKRRVYLNKL